VTTNNDQLGSVTGRLSYTWGQRCSARGRLAFRDNNDISVTIAGVPQPFTAMGDTRTATPSVGVSGRIRTQLVAGRIPVTPACYHIHDRVADILGTDSRRRAPSGPAQLGFGWGGPVPARY
jgi:outer membrane immunogenic protein